MAFRRFCYHFGYAVREAGQTLDRFGCRLQGDYAFREQLSRHRRITQLYDKKPAISQDVFVAPNASVMGAVKVGQGASVWYGAVIRGDVNQIEVGEKSAIGNRVVIHSSSVNDGQTKIGKNVVVGDGALIHACTLEDSCLVETGAIVFDGAVVGSNAIVGPGAVVTKGKKVGAGQYWEGNPAKYVRDVSAEEREQIVAKVDKLYLRSKDHEKEALKTTFEKDAEIAKRATHRPTATYVSRDPSIQATA